MKEASRTFSVLEIKQGSTAGWDAGNVGLHSVEFAVKCVIDNQQQPK